MCSIQKQLVCGAFDVMRQHFLVLRFMLLSNLRYGILEKKKKDKECSYKWMVNMDFKNGEVEYLCRRNVPCKCLKPSVLHVHPRN